jgi:hypothetical protein
MLRGEAMMSGTPPQIQAEVLGAELARSVVRRFGPAGEGVTALASAMRLESERVQDELAYLSIVTLHFCIGVAMENSSSRARVTAAFYQTLWSDPWRATADGLEVRVREYERALNSPHPQYGRAYGMGRAFARMCAASHEVPVIEFGARAYLDQLTPILDLLRGVTAV